MRRLAERLVAQPEPEPALSIAEERLEAAGLTIEHPRGGVLAAHRGEGGLALSGHVDVVPVSEEWSADPFGGSFQDGRLYGRGTSDMRGPVAAMIAALERTQAPASIVLTTDEETQMGQVRALVDDGYLDQAEAIVVGEPTGMDVAVAGNGVLWARVEVTGDRGHASTPRGEAGRGPSAPERLVEVVSDLPSTPLKVEHPRVGGATLAVSGLDSEETPFNVLAGEAKARVDVRFPPPKMPDDVERALRSHLDLPREGVELSFAKREPAFLGDEAIGAQACEALHQAGVEAELVGVGYASEAGHWQRIADTLICGPGSIDRAHKADEYVDADELEAGVEGYASLVEAFA